MTREQILKAADRIRAMADEDLGPSDGSLGAAMHDGDMASRAIEIVHDEMSPCDVYILRANGWQPYQPTLADIIGETK